MPRRAADTNVLVRILADDGTEQVARARALLREGIFLGVTVMLETEWVLRSRYKYSRQEINELMSGLLRMPNVEVVKGARLREAILAHRKGLDFADALHLYMAEDCEEFITFDKDFVQVAQGLTGVPMVREP
jgi:predicted nucleic-acid-binding protein